MTPERKEQIRGMTDSEDWPYFDNCHMASIVKELLSEVDRLEGEVEAMKHAMEKCCGDWNIEEDDYEQGFNNGIVRIAHD